MHPRALYRLRLRLLPPAFCGGQLQQRWPSEWCATTSRIGSSGGQRTGPLPRQRPGPVLWLTLQRVAPFTIYIAVPSAIRTRLGRHCLPRTCRPRLLTWFRFVLHVCTEQCSKPHVQTHCDLHATCGSSCCYCSPGRNRISGSISLDPFRGVRTSANPITEHLMYVYVPHQAAATLLHRVRSICFTAWAESPPPLPSEPNATGTPPVVLGTSRRFHFGSQCAGAACRTLLNIQHTTHPCLAECHTLPRCNQSHTLALCIQVRTRSTDNLPWTSVSAHVTPYSPSHSCAARAVPLAVQTKQHTCGFGGNRECYRSAARHPREHTRSVHCASFVRTNNESARAHLLPQCGPHISPK